jgi:hypothetical protein
MYPHEGSGESAQPINYLQPLPSAVPPMGQGSGHAAPDADAIHANEAHSSFDPRPRDSGVLGKLGFGRGGADQADHSASRSGGRLRRMRLPNRPLFLGDLLAGVASIVLFFASFAPFVSYDSAKLTDDLKKNDLSTWFSAWSAQTFMAPLTWFVVLAALLVLAISAHRYFRGDNDVRVLTFTLPQLQLVFALFSAMTLIGFAASRKSVLFGADFAAVVGKIPATTAFDTRLSFSFGGYLMLLAALVAIVGAVLNVLNIERTVLPRTAKPVSPPRGAPRTDNPFYAAATPTSGPGAHSQPYDAPVSGQPRSAPYEAPSSGQPLPDRYGSADQPSSGVPSQYGGLDSTRQYGGQFGAGDGDGNPYGSASGAGQYGSGDTGAGQFGAPPWDATRQQSPDSAWPAPQVEATQLYGQMPPEQQRYEPNPASEEPPPYEQTQYNPSAYEPEQPDGQDYGQHSRRQNPPGTVYGRPPS